MARNSRFAPEALYSVGLTFGLSVVSCLSDSFQPLRTAAVHETDIAVAVDFEKPKAVGSEPVIVIAVNDHRVVGRDAGATNQLFECFPADDIPSDLVLQLRLPVKANRAGNMPAS
jgi:hypothetical protein